MERLEVIWRSEGREVNPVCKTTLLEPDGPTDRCLILFHGITNCPRQFVKLGQDFQHRGYRVLIPRAPHHGLADRLTSDLKILTTAELIRFAEESADIGRELAEHITVAGLSMGGVLAGWLGQQRSDVARAVLIAPVFAPHGVPAWIQPATTKILSALPNLDIWWDSKQKQTIKPPYAYPRISTRAYAAMLGVGVAVRAAARQEAPRTGSLAVVLNAFDPAVNNAATEQLIRDWRRHGKEVETFVFQKDAKLPHDLIDPSQDDERTDFVYPILTRMIAGAEPSVA
jgi:esterase/lipase